ncbi:MAG: PEPxxWA-CTERM sorting domain-containing protein [Parasphingorhabdus sp.]|uniref:PEPxxWA-CTERM sorting domain-containing protein n=1 Tax=Parasphingorhabdus sp. TaxID=2709688 RepID=UPI0032976E9B
MNIFTTPAGITLPEGSEAVNWTNQLENSFTVTGGAVTSFAFFALTGAGGSAATELCLNDGAASFDALNRACPAGLNFIGTGGATEFGFNFDGSDGISFTAIAPSVPEPATWAFMIFGFGTIGGAMRRQRKVNVKVSYA